MRADFLNKYTLIKFAIIVFTIMIIGLGGCEKRRDYNTNQTQIITNNQQDSTTNQVLKNNIPRNEEKKLSPTQKEKPAAKDTSAADSSK